jgi:hypothetical protein
MKLLYKAYACEDLKSDGGGKVLLPGRPAGGELRLRPGDRLRIEFADGTWLVTTVLGEETLRLDDAMARRFSRAPGGLHCAAKIPGSFSHPMIDQGALVYLWSRKDPEDSTPGPLS